MKDQCQRCNFWEAPAHQDELHDDDKYGLCRSHPAVFVGVSQESSEWACQEVSSWSQPVMYATDWCGEFKPKPVGASIPVAIEKSL